MQMITKKYLLFILFIVFILNCITTTESFFDEQKLEAFQQIPINSLKKCQKINLEYILFLELKNSFQAECNLILANESFRFTWKKEDTYHSSFIVPLKELNHYGMLPFSLLAGIGLIPNYEERKVSVFAKVYSSKGILWEKEYYHYYERWSSFLFIPIMPIRYFLNKESIPDQTLISILEKMVQDYKSRGLLENE